MESPSFKDSSLGTVCESDSDSLIRDVFTKAMGVSTDNIYFTYLVKCYTKGDKPTYQHAEKCYKYLLEEIREIQPKCIAILGELGLNFLCGMQGILKNRGEHYDITVDGRKIPVIPTFLPGYLKYNEKQLKNFATDLATAYNIAEGMVTDVERSVDIVICDTIDKVIQLSEYVREEGVMVFDYETANMDDVKEHTALDWFRKSTIATCVSVSFMPGVSYVIPLEHQESPFKGESLQRVLDILNELYGDYNIRKVAHNIKFDMHVAAKYGAIFKGRLDDTMLMHSLLDELAKHGLKDLTEEYLVGYGGYEDEVKKYKWEEVPLNVLLPYCGTDTAMTYMLWVHFENLLLEDNRVYTIYRNLTMPACKVLYTMEHRGTLIDRESLIISIRKAEKLIESKELKLRSFKEVVRFEEYESRAVIGAYIAKLQTKLESTDKEYLQKRYREKLSNIDEENLYQGINFGSPKQLARLLYSETGFNFKSFDGGTGKDVLKELDDSTGFIDELLNYRTLKKLSSTYLKGILERLDDNNYLHTTFLVNGTVSGRLSSRNPNLQNIPNVAKLKDADVIDMVGTIKKLFIVEEGHTFFNWDLSQAELRMIALFAKDDTMMKAYNDGKDLHKITGAHLAKMSLEEFEKKPKDFQKEKRTRAKAANFGLIYGISVEGYRDYAKKTYGISMTMEEADLDIQNFFNLYNKIPEYHAIYKAKARKFGYVRTLYGRKRQTPNIRSNNGALRSADERIAVNSPIQGTVGELAIFTLVMMYFRFPESVHLTNTVHDSIMASVPDGIREHVSKLAVHTAENLPNLKYFGKDLVGMKMKMDAEYSKINWKEMEDYLEG